MSKRVFVVWRKFQRRVESLCDELDIEPLYFHYDWEERSRFAKALSYPLKFMSTLIRLGQHKPAFIFLQLAPTPVLYAAALYCAITRAEYISDCHNTMIYDSWWIKWPFAKSLLRRSKIIIVHNQDVLEKAEQMNLPATIVRDPMPRLSATPDRSEPGKKYVIAPFGMADDEPFEELFDAIRKLPDTPFYMTWFADRLPDDVRKSAPENLHFTGFLEEDEFNKLFSNASAALVLTTREGTQPSGAAEAISLGVPLVVSNIGTTRRLYGDAAILVDNRSDAIASGVEKAFAESAFYRDQLKALQQRFDEEIAVQLSEIESRLGT